MIEPKTLSHPEQENIPLQYSLDPEKISHYFSKEDTVAVFGSSHSAILAIRYLTELPVKKVINFYLDPLRYAVYLDNWILFDDTGLKGTTAIWARENIDGTLPQNLERYLSHQPDLEAHLPLCNKAVDAIGFEKRHLPIVEGMSPVKYNDKCGIIAPGLFGCGIGFPEGKLNPFDILEHRVGLWKFMDYLKRVIPVWLRYSL